VTEELSEALARQDPRGFARAVGAVVTSPEPPVDAVEALLDGWAAGNDEELAVAAVTAYGEVATARPDWSVDETRKLVLAMTHPSPTVRAAASRELQRIRRTTDER